MKSPRLSWNRRRWTCSNLLTRLSATASCLATPNRLTTLAKARLRPRVKWFHVSRLRNATSAKAMVASSATRASRRVPPLRCSRPQSRTLARALKLMMRPTSAPKATRTRRTCRSPSSTAPRLVSLSTRLAYPVVPKIDIFVSGKYVVSTTWASNIKEAIQKYEEKNPGLWAGEVKAQYDRRNARKRLHHFDGPWAGEVKAQYDKRGSDKQAKRVNFTSMADVERFAAQEGDLSASASAAWEGARKGGKEAKEALEKHADKRGEYAASMSQDNQAHHAVADHQKEIQAGKYGPTPLSISSSKHKIAYVAHVPGHTNSKGEAAPWVIKQHNTDKILESFKSEGAAKEGLKNMESHKGSDESAAPEIRDHINKNVAQARQGKDALKDHHASFDAAKWGGLGKKQASSLWVGSAKKIAAEFDEFTRGYIETALWSTNDESDPSGGVPLDQNYDVRDLAPSCLQAMTQDCAKFQAENAELLAAASEQDGQD